MSHLKHAARWLALALALPAVSAFGREGTPAPEPDVALAKLWWPDQRNVWTPIGWKDHFFRFNVLYNGAVIYEPFSDMSSRANARKWKGSDFQLTFTPWPDGDPPPPPKERVATWRLDGGHGIQGWRVDKKTPVLWTDFPLQEGMVMREEVFGHIHGGRDVVTGMEPLYAWIRVSVTHVDPLRAPAKFPMIVRLSRNDHEPTGHYRFEDGVTVDIIPERAAYPKELRAEPAKRGLRILEPDGKVRLTAFSDSPDRLSFAGRGKGVYLLKADLAARAGDSVDLLMPMFAQPAGEIGPEEALGFDGALGESESYWAHNAVPGARFDVPEEHVNRVVEQSVKFAALLGAKDCVKGDYAMLSGSWGYDQLWATPTSMNSHMFLSLLGCNDMVAHYSALYRAEQGTVKPPGPGYALHPGYFSTPKHLASIDWLADHGAILQQVGAHALLSGDPKFIGEWIEPIVKACDFIKDACARTGHDGVIGLPPPAVATDDGIPTQAVWSLGWNYKGLTTAVRLLKQLKHPRAGEFEALAGNYKAIFVKAYRERSAEAPKWADASGQSHPVLPYTLSKTPMPFNSCSDAFYLDGGPLVLVWAGLLDAADPLMQSCVKFFREGPNTKLRGTRFNPLCRPVLEHEISTCEPCYSWNIVHSWQLGDRPRFLEGMYSLFVGALSQQTYISCEHRHGMQGNLFATPTAFWLARQSVIDDEIAPGELHLLRLCPSAWLTADREAVFEGMPTLYGPVNLRCKTSADGRTLQVRFSGQWREAPREVVLHSPPLPGLEEIEVNGERHRAGGAIILGNN